MKAMQPKYYILQLLAIALLLCQLPSIQAALGAMMGPGGITLPANNAGIPALQEGPLTPAVVNAVKRNNGVMRLIANFFSPYERGLYRCLDYNAHVTMRQLPNTLVTIHVEGVRRRPWGCGTILQRFIFDPIRLIFKGYYPYPIQRVNRKYWLKYAQDLLVMIQRRPIQNLQFGCYCDRVQQINNIIRYVDPYGVGVSHPSCPPDANLLQTVMLNSIPVIGEPILPPVTFDWNGIKRSCRRAMYSNALSGLTFNNLGWFGSIARYFRLQTQLVQGNASMIKNNVRNSRSFGFRKNKLERMFANPNSPGFT